MVKLPKVYSPLVPAFVTAISTSSAVGNWPLIRTSILSPLPKFSMRLVALLPVSKHESVAAGAAVEGVVAAAGRERNRRRRRP